MRSPALPQRRLPFKAPTLMTYDHHRGAQALQGDRQSCLLCGLLASL